MINPHGTYNASTPSKVASLPPLCKTGPTCRPAALWSWLWGAHHDTFVIISSDSLTRSLLPIDLGIRISALLLCLSMRSLRWLGIGISALLCTRSFLPPMIGMPVSAALQCIILHEVWSRASTVSRFWWFPTCASFGMSTCQQKVLPKWWMPFKFQFQATSISTAIGLWKHRIPSDLRSKSKCRPVSTMVGDHTGILGAVVFFFFFFVFKTPSYHLIICECLSINHKWFFSFWHASESAKSNWACPEQDAW